MSSNKYEYSGLLARTWDLWRGDTANWSDRNLYREIIERYGEPVLDVGCGTGRLLLDYWGLGLDIDGIDTAEDMLEICRRKAAALGHAPPDIERHIQTRALESLASERRYGTILASSSVLQLLIEPERTRRALQAAFEHLKPGGALIASFGFVWLPGQPTERDWSLLFERVRPEDGALVHSWTREWWEPEKQWWHTEQRFSVTLNGVEIDSELQRRSPEGRWYTQEQASSLYREAGFTEVRVLHGFSGRPAEPDAEVFCVLGVKPSATPA